MINVILLGQPCGKGRPRFTKTGHTYTPEKTATYENRLASQAVKAVRGVTPIILPVAISIEAYFEIPKSWGKKKTNEALQGDLLHVSKPDIDNVIKIVLDALNGIVYKDDAQVCSIMAVKQYSNNPRLEIVISVNV